MTPQAETLIRELLRAVVRDVYRPGASVAADCLHALEHAHASGMDLEPLLTSDPFVQLLEVLPS